MAEQTNPATPAGVGEAPELSVEQRLGNYYKAQQAREQHKPLPKAPQEQVPSEAAPAETAQPQEDQATAEAEGSEAKPAEETEATDEGQSEGGEATPDEFWTIRHNGADVKLTRDELIEHAQKGFDYERGRAAVNEERKALQQAFAMVQQMAQQEAPEIREAEIELQGIVGQLKAWEQVNWVQLAAENPVDYPRYRAQYDELQRQAGQKWNALSGRKNAFNQRRAAMNDALLQQEMARLPDLDPDFRKPEKFAEIKANTKAYLLKRGVPEYMIDEINLAPVFAVAYDAYRYSKIANAKPAVEKQVRAAAPLAKPAAAQSPQTAAERDYRAARAQLKKSGSVDDAARLLAGLGAGNRK